MSTVLILGDVHLGKSTSIGKTGIGAALNSRIVDQLNLLDWVLEYAVDHGVRRIVITGDVFEDPKPLPSLITLFIAWINKCGAYEVNIDIIMGNHDMLRNGTYYSSPLDIITECSLPNCTVYKDINTVYIDRVAFTYLPFRDRKSFSCEVNADALALLDNMLMYEVLSIPIPFTKVLIGHLALEGSIAVGDEIDDLTNELFCPTSMFKDYDYVWMGHVHKPQVMCKQPHIAHVGSMDISNFGETDHKKHVVLFETEDSTFTTVDLPTRNLSRIVITIPKDTVDTTQYVLDEIKSKKITLDKSIVRLEICLSTPELKSINRSEVEKFLYKEGAYNIAGFSESKKIALIKKDNGSANNIDTTMDVPTSIKMWAKQKWPDDVDESKRLKFIEAALIIYKDYLAGAKV